MPAPRPIAILIASWVIAVGASAQAQVQPVSDPDTRARQTLEAMTPQERLALLRGFIPGLTPPDKLPAGTPNSAGFVPGLARLGLPTLTETDASLGVSNMGGVMRPNDGATALPSAAAMASSWSPELVERGGAMIGAEARAKGFNVLLAGGVNLVREPRNGRNFEYFSEDPLLSGVLGGHAIGGVQSNHIVSTVKHFALNAQETGRTELDAHMDEASLRETDLLAFQLAIEIGQPGSVMCAYNKVNTVYACENSFLLNDVLRRDWKYKGYVMSDWGAVHSPSIRQGLDQESGTKPKDKPYFGALLSQDLAAGRVQAADVDRAALRILRSLYALGVVDHPVAQRAPIDEAAHAQVAQDIAEAGLVLLKNDGDLLPIKPATRRVLVIGAHADVGVLGGGGSSQVLPMGGPALTLDLPGEPIWHRKMYAPSSPLAELRARLPNATVSYDDGTDPIRAAAAAIDYDLVIVFVEQFTAEGKDVADLSLPGGQDQLVAKVAAANRNTVVVLESGGPVLMPWLDKAPAVVAAWYSGQRGGRAIARVLTGEVNPAGRLPVTFPASLDQLPNPALPGADKYSIETGKSLYDVDPTGRGFIVTYPEGADVGHRWYDRRGLKPLFAFGHGLSYTRFSYGNLALTGGDALSASFDVSNAGARAGVEIAQLYVRIDGVRRLAGWSRVDLEPGQTRRVTIQAEPRILARYDTRKAGWRLKGGRYVVEVSAAIDAPRLSGEARLKARRLKP
ncbi:beta-glucosidase [Caulobacter sp. LARHSG274]